MFKRQEKILVSVIRHSAFVIRNFSASGQADAAVDRHVHADDVAGVVGEEKAREPGHFISRA
jgi:hypothetical protein